MVHEGVLLESRSLRNGLATRTDVLDRVKALSLLPDDLHVTTRMVADYFEVPVETVRSLVKDHRAELEENGYTVLTREKVRSFRDLTSLDKYAGRHLALYTRRTVLNVAMLLRDSAVARAVTRRRHSTSPGPRTGPTPRARRGASPSTPSSPGSTSASSGPSPSGWHSTTHSSPGPPRTRYARCSGRPWCRC
ncbi:hypothetical protein [Streptomyces sp. JJ36]|uniref:hypothetical protein n=1 Tax=Streptomyces sp. JJ36 TaxID=2736645 RepID=UPI001F32D7AF|nr:hypothetical protein [Streptomyces sp. JJ36]MCF6522175.1 hypothetical protein [Streptomyces sp. JJ36]